MYILTRVSNESINISPMPKNLEKLMNVSNSAALSAVHSLNMIVKIWKIRLGPWDITYMRCRNMDKIEDLEGIHNSSKRFQQ